MSYAKTLRAVGAGHTVIVLAVDAPEAQRQRLESIGVLPGVELDVLADNGGPILVAVGQARVAVERALAATVIVA
ncbi:FeoA domain-containing protein [Desulfovibrio legallii]|uniref:Ferrous iron transport protein A n=1 Tax=Desulfovibrio legallii TaxID=571438 RepID=A0A6H3F7S3_9BACT|nr:FeoA domain-containing protein [Desulfovibrio legallii]RHH24088.1 ferrous iron transport protein A [Desulfovibrio sp. AM18-2]TBH81540.1 ferrous iron transport protein A [Desulfovibrio legallii]CAI3234874.1 hypothetical protein DWUX_1475 [Desulfovibrio diazotrophicus]